MKNSDFIINQKLVWFLVIGNTLLTIIGSLGKIYGWPYSHIVVSIGLTLYFSTWVIIVSDILKQNIYNKVFWIVIIIITPSIASIFYMFQRKKLIRLGNKLQ